MTTDPVVRYAAALILVATFLSALVLALHGYWLDPHYQMPPIAAAVMGSGVTAAATLLGVHIGTVGAFGGVEKGAAMARDGVGDGTTAGAQRGGS